VVRDSPEVLKPLVAPRAPLGNHVGARSPSLLAPQIARLEDEISRVRKVLRAQRAETRIEQQKNEHLRAEVEALRKEPRNSEATEGDEGSLVQRLKRKHQKEISQLREEYQAVTQQLEARCAHEIALLEEKHAAKLNALRNSLSVAEELTLAKTERIRRLEARLTRLQLKGTLAPEPVTSTGSADDLTLLSGVGPVYARALRRRGVSSLSQIASWTTEDIRTIAPQIGTTEARILREGWVLQAQRFASE
jgi:predicted flap endonuclease-1-like 5' DNA nuclease